ncbi:stage II sporulation protein M [Candidatus Woesearchaeota archaeon]|nr:stage II sporulation protein M [Candidatus Woesearchaeota archaeon]
MVFEQLIRVHWLERRPLAAFMIGVAYSVLGILFARFIFAGNPGLAAVAFISLLILPSVSKLLLEEENAEIREKKFSLQMLVKDHKDIMEIYFFLFLGIFLTFAVIAAIFPQQAVIKLFQEQLTILANYRGYALSFDNPLWSIMFNNLKIAVICFIMSFFYGAGGILLIVWNASVWGAITGYIVSEAAASGQGSLFVIFFLTLLPLLPHMIIEVASYFFAAVSGGVISKATLREKVGSKKFHHVMTDGLLFIALSIIFVIVGAVVETKVFPVLFRWLT